VKPKLKGNKTKRERGSRGSKETRNRDWVAFSSNNLMFNFSFLII
jgi:hypothetical protein